MIILCVNAMDMSGCSTWVPVFFLLRPDCARCPPVWKGELSPSTINFFTLSLCVLSEGRYSDSCLTAEASQSVPSTLGTRYPSMPLWLFSPACNTGMTIITIIQATAKVRLSKGYVS